MPAHLVAGIKRGAKKTAARQTPLVTTKLRPPSNRGALIQRPQLLETLRGTLERKLALIHGPAGFGKTTLATQWFSELKGAGTSVAWLAVDASDNDINRFLSYLVEAVRSAEPDMGAGLGELIEANPGSAADFVLDTLVNDLSLHGDDLVLFIDDWHLVHEDAVHTVLQLLLTRSPPNLHVVVTSRTRAGMPLSRLRVQNELVEIDAARLRFDLDESRAYLTDAKALKLDADDLNALWRSTEGWAAALQLASLSLREVGDRDRILQWTSGATNDIGEYLAENVVNNLPADQLGFMLKTSILERLSGELCVAVTGEKDSAVRLDALEQQEMFLLPLDEERQWFRWHHLFVRYLQRRLHKQMPDRIAGLHRAAAQWLGAHGHTGEALDQALAANDTALAVDLVERDAMGLVEHSFMSTLLNLVSKLPRTALFDRPHLQMAIAWANCLTHRPQETEEALWHVERVAASAPPQQKMLLLGEANVVRACSAIYGDKVVGLDHLVRPCLDKPDVFRPWAVGVAANILAYLHIHAAEFDAVSPLLRWARDYQDRAQGLFSGVYGRCFEGIAELRAGRLKNARRAFTDAMDVAARTAGKQSNSARLASALLGQLLYEENDLDKAERLLRESRFLGFEGGVVEFYLATYLSSARLAVQKGASADALALLQEGEDTARALALDRLGVAMAGERVRVRLAMGDVRAAEQALAEIDSRRDAVGRGSVPDSEEVQAFIAMAKARLLCARGSASAAVRLLRAQVQSAHRRGWTLQELSARIVLAAALDLDGQGAEAEQELALTIDQAVPCGMVRSFLDEGAPLFAILERLRDRGRRAGADPSVFSVHAQRLFDASRDADHGMPGVAGSPPRTLKFTAREIAVLRLLDQGRCNKDVARTLSISVDTVKWYLKNIFIKLGVSTRLQAITELRRMNLLGNAP